MVDPFEALVTAALILGVILIFFFPEKGIIARRKKLKKNNQRVLIEDALKHLYDCEYKNVSCTIHSVAGNLSIHADEAAKLLERLENMGLLISDNNELHLTGEGRSYALRVIRIHRLWEKYLADETGTQEILWHKEAEEKEHLISSEQADLLAAKMGNPIFDPHGDPIPTINGEVPSRKGKPLSAMRSGEIARIIHIEDEPASVYAQLVAEGLYAGMHIRMIESDKERIRFEANGDEVILAPLFASGISVADLPVEEKVFEKYKRLSSLKSGESGEVIGISKACRGQQRRRLMDLGVVPGTKITAELVSTGGDPVAYNIRGALIALRRQHAELIFIKDAIGSGQPEKELKEFSQERMN